MKYKTLIISIVGVLSTLLVGFALINTTYNSYVLEPEIGIQRSSAATSTTSANPNKISTTKEDFPVRIQIPSLKVNASVQQRGINAKGEMATPTNFRDVAWYKLGTIPGKTGSAVMAGHLDNAIALSGVFKNLEDINIGADIYVVMNSGKKLHFIVEDKETYAYNKAPLSSIFNKKDKPRLNLVTCEGKWIKEKKTYSERLVVYSTLKS